MKDVKKPFQEKILQKFGTGNKRSKNGFDLPKIKSERGNNSSGRFLQHSQYLLTFLTV